MGKDDYGEYVNDVKSKEKQESQLRMDDGMGFQEIELKRCKCGKRIYQDVYNKATICVDCRTEGK